MHFHPVSPFGANHVPQISTMPCCTSQASPCCLPYRSWKDASCRPKDSQSCLSKGSSEGSCNMSQWTCRHDMQRLLVQNVFERVWLDLVHPTLDAHIIYICIICIYIILIIYNTLYTCSICIRILLGIVPSAEHLGQSLSWDFAHDLSDAELRGATQLEICRTRFLPRGDQVVSLGSIRWVATLATTHQFSEHMWIWWGFDTLYILIYIDIHCHIVNFEESDLMTMIMAPSFTKAVQGIHRNLHAAHWNRPPRGRRVSREMQWFDLRLQDGAPQWCLLVYNPH